MPLVFPSHFNRGQYVLRAMRFMYGQQHQWILPVMGILAVLSGLIPLIRKPEEDLLLQLAKILVGLAVMLYRPIMNVLNLRRSYRAIDFLKGEHQFHFDLEGVRLTDHHGGDVTYNWNRIKLVSLDKDGAVMVFKEGNLLLMNQPGWKGSAGGQQLRQILRQAKVAFVE